LIANVTALLSVRFALSVQASANRRFTGMFSGTRLVSMAAGGAD
jgi:hypothetical protein